MIPFYKARIEISLLFGLLALAGCGSTGATAKTRTIVFTRGDVVTAASDRSEKQGRKLGRWLLPPLPVRLQDTSEAFQQGFQAAVSTIDRPGPEIPLEAGPEQFDAWIRSGFQKWLSESVEEVKKCRELLDKVAPGPANEAVVAAALVGLIDEHFDKLFDEIPIPPKLRGDQELIDIYRQQLDRVRLSWLKKSITALVHCVSEASRQKAPIYQQWKHFCAEHAYALDASHRGIKRRVEQAEEQARLQAERISLFGIRPQGPAVCWRPSMGRGPGTKSEIEAANSVDTDRPAEAAEPDVSPRDREYGPVDLKTGVRVSIQSGDSEAFDLAPLHDERTRKKLAACFVKSYTRAQEVTAAIEVSISLSKRGKVESVNLTTADPTQAAYLGPKTESCLAKAFRALRFSSSATGEGSAVNALICMRRAEHDHMLDIETGTAADQDAALEKARDADHNGSL
ncbi:MAG: hypothetical protein JXA30_08500 [Deltaproteobacteria bacterium]|nr:hypothetical protein [Deltaproteobacteria bacterium]